jgi:hypothetical protein
MPIPYTTLKLATDLEVAFGNTKYHHQDGGIPNTEITSILFDNGSRTDERGPSILYKLSGQFGHKLQSSKVGITT